MESGGIWEVVRRLAGERGKLRVFKLRDTIQVTRREFDGCL